MLRSALIASLLALETAVAAAAPIGAQYAQDIAAWRNQFDADIRKDGWLETVGREKIPEGSSTLGASPGSGIVLPPPAPALVGTLTRRNDRFEFEPATGTAVSIDERPVTTRAGISTEPGTGKIRVGSLALSVRQISNDFYLNISDANSPAIAAFKGTSWFRVDPAYRVKARFLPYAKPQDTVLTLTFASATKVFVSTGDVAFQLRGQSLKLKTFVLDDELFLIFQDKTNGIETYGGGRFLFAPMPKNGLTTLDFNKAFNPYCAVNPFAICPIAPSVNRLPVRIAAGAKVQK